MSEFDGLEIWRGGVNSWECDALGHMNVRFYVARAVEGLVGLASAVGLSGAFRERANATLLIKDHHIRFLREAHAGTPLHMVGGLLDIQECEARFLQLLIHSRTGQVAASFQTRVAHVTTGDGRAFPWSQATRLSAEGLRIGTPEGVAPRSLDLGTSSGRGTLAMANSLGLAHLGTGAIGVSDCDIFGRMRPDILVGRISDGDSGLGGVLPAGPDKGDRQESDIGTAVLEYRLAYLAWPRAGDRYVIRSGLAAVGDKTRNFVHWMLNPETGRIWGSSEAVAISLDLATRRIVPLSLADQAFLGTRITPGLLF